jgi:hypothetical protein
MTARAVGALVLLTDVELVSIDRGGWGTRGTVVSCRALTTYLS